jgi:hypothetical protein
MALSAMPWRLIAAVNAEKHGPMAGERVERQLSRLAV